MKEQGLFIAATGQHVGKTTTSLGLLAGLAKRYKRVGFLKPIGQEHVDMGNDVHVDKDVLLCKNYFRLQDESVRMSPVLLPGGFTKDYLDGKITEESIGKKIVEAFRLMREQNDFLVVEGTGHVGVGSIVNFSNARIASMLSLPMVLIASGGIGSSFDILALNKALCDAHNVRIAGIILNKVIENKREMVFRYMKKALERWNIPLLGCIPFVPVLTQPSMQDFVSLFQRTLLAGKGHGLRTFRHTRLVATPLDTFRDRIIPNQLVITPADREDVILAVLTKSWDMKIADPLGDLEAGLILVGSIPPKRAMIEALRKADIPTLYAPLGSYQAMEMITSYTTKIRKEETGKIREAIDVTGKYVDFATLLS
ncbi:MAG: AAA family ATPase [Simkaniaceae bacterium]|nr:AAA family ATPase [Simkaniaceae bacterium]